MWVNEYTVHSSGYSLHTYVCAGICVGMPLYVCLMWVHPRMCGAMYMYIIYSMSVVYTTLNYVTLFLHLIAIREEVDTDDDHIQ